MDKTENLQSCKLINSTIMQNFSVMKPLKQPPQNLYMKHSVCALGASTPSQGDVQRTMPRTGSDTDLFF